MQNTLIHDRYARATQLVMSGVYDYYDRFPTSHRFFSTTNLSPGTHRITADDGQVGHRVTGDTTRLHESRNRSIGIGLVDDGRDIA